MDKQDLYSVNSFVLNPLSRVSSPSIVIWKRWSCMYTETVSFAGKIREHQRFPVIPGGKHEKKVRKIPFVRVHNRTRVYLLVTFLANFTNWNSES